MRIRQGHLTILVFIVAISSVLIITAVASKPSTSNKAVTPPSYVKPSQSPKSQANIPGTIDGKKNPELIPDRVVHLALFRAVPEQTTDKSRMLARAYASQILGGCSQCKMKDKENYEKAKKDHDQDIDALLGVAAEFQQRVGALDRQATEIKDRNWPNPSPTVLEQLAKLQTQKEIIVDELITSLSLKIKIESKNGMKGYISSAKSKIIAVSFRMSRHL